MPPAAPSDFSASPATPRRSPGAGPWAAIALALSDIKIAHSVFAMPFALLAAVMSGSPRRPVGDGHPAHSLIGVGWLDLGVQLCLVVLCMVLARTWAMLVNRLADARFDAANARTAGRAIASGRLSPREGLWVALTSAAAFTAACAVFWFGWANPWPILLALPVLGWIALYSYTKRFTFLCHLFLGGALAASPLAASIAIDPEILAFAQRTPAGTGVSILFLSAFVLLWVAGFDIAYALQDIDFDRRAGLHSIPARLGPHGALWVGRAFHAVAFVFLVLAWRAEPRFGAMMLGAVALVEGLLIFEHLVLARRGVAGLPIAFFTVNGVVSCLLGAAGIADVLA